MEDLSLHILDIVENSTSAGATLNEIYIIQDTISDILRITIKDNGRGMDSEMLRNVRDPFVTSRTTRRVGLGISMLDQSVREADGELILRSEPGRGTEVVATFKNSHIDRKPLGDMCFTIISLILGSPEIDFIYESDLDGHKISLNTREIKDELDGVSITSPEVIQLIRDLFEKTEG